MNEQTLPPANLVIASLAQFDRGFLISPDGKRVEVSVEAIQRLMAGQGMVPAPPRQPG